ncbi:diguanylate cyclase [Clostridium sp. LIBA-8841]|uniref:tetratricopeptide repeat-containing diguanylate cyclase n=1 Tax=Clostridium sp. LIBA-8841 TaxID=2987530 RepID=UPI002AC5088E|nr:diguanylate cyclase [Clostridium sp. LIBA-8841]MDZ5253340.1 diguanylate cyclase [Clostridium sp. LIBA-8841]
MKFKVIIYALIIFIFGAFIEGYRIYLEKTNNYSYADQFIEIVKLDEERELKSDKLQELKCELEKEIINSKDEIHLKKAYYSLGSIEYLEKNYNKAIELLLKAESYIDRKIDCVDLMIYSALSTNYLMIEEKEESEKYFNKAKKMALDNKKSDELANMYYARAKAILSINGKLSDAIVLMEESIEFNQSYENRIRAYLLLSTMYRLSGKYDLSLKYDEYAIEIALKHNDNKNLNACIINLGENYYVKRDYNKVISVYESLIESGNVTSPENKLTIYGYLLESHFEVGNYSKVQSYEEKYLSTIKELEEEEQNREYIWLYLVLSDINLREKKLECGEYYFSKASELYNKDKSDAYANTDILLKKLDININYIKTDDFKKAIYEYEELLNEIKSRGISTDILYSVAYSIARISYENEDYEKFSKYIIYMYEEFNEISANSSTDDALVRLNNDLFNKDRVKDRRKIYSLSGLLIIAIVTISIIHLKNKKIKNLNKELELAILTDGLTNVYNKRYLYRVLEDSINKCTSLVFIMMDIDYFKKYNDNYGHMKGDEALISVANIIKNVFKEDYVFRYGGEEFSVLSERPKMDVIKDIEKLMNDLHERDIKHEYSKISDRVTLSIGVSKSTIISKKNIEELIRDADKKLYESKKKGRNRYTS